MEKLYKLLCDSFSPEEFEQIVRFGGGFGGNAGAIRRGLLPAATTPPSLYFFNALELLSRHGVLNRRFFAALRDARPLRAAAIAEVERGLVGSLHIVVWPALKQFVYALLVLASATWIAHGWVLDSARVASAAPEVVPCPVDVTADVPDAQPVETAKPTAAPVLVVTPTPAPARRRAAPRRETHARDIPPPLSATLPANVAEINLGQALRQVDRAALAGLSFVVEVRPDGRVDGDSLVLSTVYGDDARHIARKIAETRFPPSLGGSGSLVCYVVRQDSASDEPLQCEPRK